MKKSVLLFAVCIYIFAGCGPKEPVEDTRKVVVFFSAKSDANSLLKSTATEDEKKIERVVLFGVNEQNVVEYYTPINNPSLTGTPLTISNNVKMLYAIANPTDAMATATPPSLSDLLATTAGFTGTPLSPFLMAGKGDVSNYNVNIEFIRTVAKISFIGKKGFAIESITVENTPDHVYVFSQAALSVPLSSAMMDYPKVESATPMVYIAENTRQNPTRFVVTGTYEHKPATYNFVLTDGGTRIDIVRNTHYQVEITPKTESECTITITIPDWNDGVNDGIVVPDSAFE